MENERPKLPRVALIAAVLAFLAAAFNVVAAIVNGPIVLIIASLIPLAAGVGMLRRRPWSAYGYALVQCASLIGVAVLQSRSPGREAALPFVASIVFGLLFAVLFFAAGRDLEGTGARRGSPIPWILLAIASAVPFLFWQAFAVPSGGMENTLLIGDKIVVKRWPKQAPRFNQIVAFSYPVDHRQIFLKRVIGLPEDHIRMEHRFVYRNGVQLREPFAVYKFTGDQGFAADFPRRPWPPSLQAPAVDMLTKDVVNGEVVVPKGKYFVLGDWRDNSLDSRYWGFVDESEIIGPAVLIYDSVEPPSSEALAKSRLALGRTRWNRIFRVL